MPSSSPLVFVYLGEFPRYGARAVMSAARTSGVPVVLVTDGEVPTSVSRWSIRAQDFYDPGEFGAASHAISQDVGFRNGFWLKTLERLFVVEQFQRASGHDTLFHAELDNLVFRLDRFDSRRGSSLPDETMTIPFWSPEVALASLMYLRGRKPLAELVRFASDGSSYSSEMHLLATFARAHPDVVVQAPSLESLTSRTDFRRDFENSQVVVGADEDWMFDASSLGQWIAGQDLANHSAPVIFNHFTNEAIADHSIRPRVRLDDEGSLCIEVGDRSVTGYNLHLHHKLHDRLPTPQHLRALFLAAGLPFRLPIGVNWRVIRSVPRRAVARARRLLSR